MSIHPSLTSSAKTKKVRSVLKRAERLKKMMEKDTWKEGQSIFALPKMKTMRLKIIKKEKVAAPAADGTAAEGETAAAEETKTEAKAASTTAKPTKKPSH